MKKYVARLESTTPIAFGRYYAPEVPKLQKESDNAYEERTWRNRVHANKNNNIVISALAFKNCLTSAAKYLGEKIPGKGNATYTKHFTSGVLITEPLVLPTKKDEAEPLWLFVPADGVRGGGKRVLKCFPLVREWAGDLEISVLDETITEEVLLHYLQEAGNFIGVGSLRVQNNGIYGRFVVKSLTEI